MPQRQVDLVAGEYYHVYNRGNNRQPVFFGRENYLFFLRRVREYLIQTVQTSEVPETSDVWGVVVAYCLMPNHFHLLLSPGDDGLSRRMQRLSISYTKAMNERYQRTGALFEGQFHAVHVDGDEYLLHLSRYIHLNPVLAGLVLKPEDWEFSSYREFIGARVGTLPRPEVVLAQVGGMAGYRSFVEGYEARDRERIEGMVFDED